MRITPAEHPRSTKKYFYRHPVFSLFWLLFLISFGMTSVWGTEGTGKKGKVAETLRCKGDYFLFSDDHDYLYGGGNIVLKIGDREVKGDAIYMDTQSLTGIIYGDVRSLKKTADKKIIEEKFDALFFKGMPPLWLGITYKDEIRFEGEQGLKNFYLNFRKMTPEELKNSSLYFEFREFRVDKNRKIRAKIVVPYMMGLPTVPLKKFTVNRGEWEEKTMLAFNHINYTGVDGLSLSFLLRMREKWTKGDYDIKLYERKLFKLDDVERGILFSGKSGILVNKKEFLDYTVLLNSGEKSFNLRLNHRKDFKYFSYSLSQTVSGREEQPTFFEFASGITINRLKVLVPGFYFTHDWKDSYTYKVSTPINVWKKLNLNVGWLRKIIKGDYRSDTSEFTSSLNFDSKIFGLSSNYNYSRNLLEEYVRKNFTVNLRLKPLKFLEDNVVFDISSYYMFSALPYGDQTQNRNSEGLNISVYSVGVSMPLGFELVPSFTFNHLWDDLQENFTDFNYSVSLVKPMGKFSASLAYALASRYRAADFWIEGNNRQNMTLNFEYKDKEAHALLLRFYFNNELALENISFTGKITLPFDLTLSSFVLYYNEERTFRTVEVFLEKSFKNKIRIQGGYSLALKRFFVKFLTM
jgi:hypothetical protein